MAATVSHHPQAPKSIKALAAELDSQAPINPIYAFQQTPNIVNDEASKVEDGIIPIIDFGLLTSSNPEERAKTIQELGKACQEWGFFMVVNHGVPESLFKGIVDMSAAFFDLPEDEKMQFKGKGILDPINYGSSMNVSVDNVLFWRDFLKVFLHPEFHPISKPQGFSETAKEYGKKLREIAGEIMKGISKSLGLEEDYFNKALNLEKGLQFMAANLYPPCPQPELAIGLPAHTDHGLLTFLIQNGIGGLQVKHKGKWFNISPLPNAILANIGDHVEIVSNGKYKSIMHRAVVNNKDARISLPMLYGPNLDTVVSPAPPLLDPVTNPPLYKSLTYREYLELQHKSKIDGTSFADHIHIR
ncbi:Oxoglutarate/iron-dependent dioxygenase [Corchorus olitorius]|uniref:Oxoglutarate/iron-dependent dioxygenase n=1 Tax=Corchorus olitorius TaxID=93759 RepID=A0A1R3GZX2_9ROSI|nr:Oxoglutarate/iron-dependent dioxygenase [Corchorus olitorius]